MLKRGDKGDGVRLLQAALRRRGYTVALDGDFGTKTDRAVRQFQAALGLQVDGRVGPSVWAELNKVIADGAKADLESRKKRLRDMVISYGLGVASGATGRRSLGDASQAAARREREGRRRDVLLLAIDQLGLRETDEAGASAGSNGGAELAHIVDEGGDGFPPSAYYAFHHVEKDVMPPWCAIFVCWAIKEALHLDSWAALPFGTWQGWVYGMEEWAKRRQCFIPVSQIDLSDPKRFVGAAFTMSRGGSHSDLSKSTKAGHTGFVVGVEGGKFVTVDGNVNNAVTEVLRDPASITGLIFWWE